MNPKSNHSSGSLKLPNMAFLLLLLFFGVAITSLALSAGSSENVVGGRLYPYASGISDNSRLLGAAANSSVKASMLNADYRVHANGIIEAQHDLQPGKSQNVSGQVIPAKPIKVKVGLELDQIAAINQKDENFDVVAAIQMQWTDPQLAFSPEQCNCNFKIYRGIDDFVKEYGSAFPEFTIFNQQGNRWTQNEMIVVQPNGTATYFERFWVKLQAPDFNFRNYPLDSQDFYARIDSLYPEDYYVYEIWPEKTKIGKQLGEEEWSITASDTNVSSVEIEGFHSRFSFHFQAQRHLSYYALRILFPMIVIVLISWVTLFLKDYGKRADIAGGNLLLFIAFNFTIGSDLPRLGYLTFLDWIMFFTFILTALMFIYNISLKLLEIRDKDKLAERIDRIMVWLYPLLYFTAAYLVPVFLYRHF